MLGGRSASRKQRQQKKLLRQERLMSKPWLAGLLVPVSALQVPHHHDPQGVVRRGLPEAIICGAWWWRISGFCCVDELLTQPVR